MLMVGMYLCLALIHSAHAAPLKVGVVLSEEGGAYQDFANALRIGLVSQNAILNVTYADQPAPEADLQIAVGLKAAKALAPAKSPAILNVFISRGAYNRLQHDFSNRPTPFSAIYLDQPIERHLYLIAAGLPNAINVGILYAHAPDDLRTLRKKATEQKLSLHEHAVTSTNGLPAALQDILGSSDVILALPDIDVYNTATIRNILLASYRARVPIVGFSSSFVRAGGLCAVFSTPAQIATQTASAIRQYAESRTLPPAQFAHEFEVSVNTQVAQSLGLNIPSASELQRAIGASE